MRETKCKQHVDYMSSFAVSGTPASHSVHIPYHARCTQLALLVGAGSVGLADGGGAVVGSVGGVVIVLFSELVVSLIIVDVLSPHPQNRPGVRHVVVIVSVLVAVGGVVEVVVEVVVAVLSLQPNQPGVSHVVVVVVVVDVDVVVPPVVVVSSRHPHHPGVLHVSVRVRVLVVAVDERDVVVDSVPLLSYIFQFPQSRQSGVNLHSGTVSYFMITS